jgi:hypothetical protein
MYVQHDDCEVESRFCLLAESHVAPLRGHVAALGHVPRQAIVNVGRIERIWCRLPVDRVREEAHFEAVKDEAEQWT